MKRAAHVKPALRLRDEVRGDPCSARRKGAHVMSHFRKFEPLRLAADDRSDALAFAWFGNRINCACQDQRRHRRGGGYEQWGAKRCTSIAEPGKLGACKDVVGCRRCVTKMRPVSAFHRDVSGNL